MLMKQPETPAELLELHGVLRSDSQKYLQIVSEWVESDPDDGSAYYDRHLAWMRLGVPERALEDLDQAINLDGSAMDYLARGGVNRCLGRYTDALADYSRGEGIDPKQWDADAILLLFQADTYARTGDEAMAIVYCNRLPDDIWTPGMNGLPPGGKSDIRDELSR
ncbi:MAG TPA: hypothetical protein VGI95_09895 [Caulobacteraceae bacterium]|jgi:tetratricopeptide (TPR) repeat protein